MTSRVLKTFSLSFISILLVLSPMGASAAVRAVPSQYRTIAEAFAASQAGDRIELAPGVYTETGLSMPNGVTLVGTGTDPRQVVLDGRNQGRILLAEGVDDATLVANITFMNGRAVGHTSYERSGGAIFCSNSLLRINNCIFERNRTDGHGGAIRCNNATPLITDCVFIGNEAVDGGGGAIDCSFDSSPLIRNCDFKNNTAAWGGALSCRGFSSPVVFSSTFDSNQAAGSKGYGGAIFADHGSTPSFNLSTITNNSARYGGGITCLSTAETNLDNCTITKNTAEVLGGGLFIYNATPHITGSIIAFQNGTGISAEGGALPVINCTDIYGNSRGDWLGSFANQLSIGDNLSADPLFCYLTTDGAEAYSLNESSPCATTTLACGFMGAWPVGCDESGTLVTTFDARWQGSVAQLTWQSHTTGSDAPAFRLTGSWDSAPDDVWDIELLDLGGGFYEAVDTPTIEDPNDIFTYRLYLADPDGNWVLVDEIKLSTTPPFAGIQNLRAHPNPFNPRTTISFQLGVAQRARISVYDPAGRRVAVLADRNFPAGVQTQRWDGKDAQGNGVGSGTYIVLVEGVRERKTQKITLIK